MPMVPPGSETGVYYMPIGNLPWQATWQDLKDFTRNPGDGQGPCEIEHAEVYRSGRYARSGGHGYVKIRGETDFWRVYHYLNGREWMTRCLQPDCRNATQPIPLSDVHVGSIAPIAQMQQNASASRNTRRSSTVDLVSNRHPNWSATTAMAQSPVSSAFDPNWDRGYYPPDPQIQAPQYSYQQGLSQTYPQYSYSTAESMATPNYLQNAVYPTAPTNLPMMPIPENTAFRTYHYLTPAVPQNVAGGYQVAYAPVPISQSTYSTTMSLEPQPPTSPTVEIEQRKILICNIPHQLASEDIRRRIAWYATFPHGRDDHAVEDLDLPTHNDTKKRKGHAFAILKDTFMAQRCIQELDGRELLGRVLDVRLAKEGVPRMLEGGSSTKASRGSASGSENSSRRDGGGDRRGGEKGNRSSKGKTSGSSSGSSKRHQASASTSTSFSTTDDSTITELGMFDDRRTAPGSRTPIVVDGSSPASSRAPSSKAPSSITSNVSASSNWSERSEPKRVERSVEKKSDRRSEEKRSERSEGKRRR